MAMAATAPSASDTRPMRDGRAPTPPRRPTMPSVGASPPARRPAWPGTTTRTKSVLPLAPCTRLDVNVTPAHPVEQGADRVAGGPRRIEGLEHGQGVRLKLISAPPRARGRRRPRRRTTKSASPAMKPAATTSSAPGRPTRAACPHEAHGDAGQHAPARDRVGDEQTGRKQHAQLSPGTTGALEERARVSPRVAVTRPRRVPRRR